MSNKITLASAMETLKSMFPTYDPKTIKDVLYRTNGHMEQTIELLLQLQNSMPSAPPVSEPEEAPVRHPTDESHIHHTLPSDFLRYDFDDVSPMVPPATQRGGSTNNTSRQQMAEDEKLALQLQRQMLFEESLTNAGLLPPSQPKVRAPAPNTSVNSRSSESHGNSSNKHFSTQGIGSKPASSASNQQSSGIDNLAHNVQKLSEIAKKKLAEFRSKFVRQGGNNSGRKDTGPAYSSLLANNNAADDDDDEFSGNLGNNRL